MFQRFNTDTLGGRFVKALLSQTPVPVYECAFDSDYIVEGCYYVYKRDIIKCTKSGYLTATPSDLMPEAPKTLEDYKATYIVTCCIDVYDPKYFSTYTSHTNYYDTDTHYHLRRYLRYLYGTTGLNLFPFYNCYAGITFPDVMLEKTSTSKNNRTYNINVRRTSKQHLKVIGVPILFGHEYTIALECSTPFTIRAALYDDSGFLDDTEDTRVKTNLRQILNNSGKYFIRSKFSQPFKFCVNANSPEDMLYQRMLYLLIQIPFDNDSSIVVLDRFDNRTGVVCDENNVQLPLFFNSSLLRMNWHTSFAFSDRLIEYLLGNVIHQHDYNYTNIVKIQEAIKFLESNEPDASKRTYTNKLLSGESTYGRWDNSLQMVILDLVKSERGSSLIYDQDGYVNKDVEAILQSKGVNY